MLESCQTWDRQFKKGISLIKSSQQHPRFSHSQIGDLIEILTEQPHGVTSIDEARDIISNRLTSLYWLHPTRMYNQLIKYNDTHPKITGTNPIDPHDVAQSIYYFRKEC
jgi:hypothetical protein